MAKRSRRVIYNPTSKRYSYAVPRFSSLVSPTNYSQLLRDIEDRRTWTPLKIRPPVYMTVGKAARIIHPLKGFNASRIAFGRGNMAFASPLRLPLCIRRKIRKQVMHALGAAGSKNLRKPRRNAFSDVSCR